MNPKPSIIMDWLVYFKYIKWATLWQNLFVLYANNRGTDQPAHQHSLIRIFVVRS